jgi:hypothetical protein
MAQVVVVAKQDGAGVQQRGCGKPPTPPSGSLTMAMRATAAACLLAGGLAACGGGASSGSSGATSSSGSAGMVTVTATSPTSGEPSEEGTAQVSIQVATGSVIRSDISRTTFGSGIAFDTPQLRWTMDNLVDPNKPPTSSKTRDALKGLQLGTLRFPNGDSSFLYISEDPQGSYPTLPAVNQWNRYLTPQEIIRYTAPDQLDMERLFEVNTAFWLEKAAQWNFRYLNDEVFNKGAPPQLNPAHLDTAATRAAQWVTRDAGQTKLWEVGNEDWARWNGEQHAEIFNVFQDKMKRVRPDIKLLAQGLAQPYNGNTPESWLQALRQKLEANGKIDSVYAYSVHQYMHGGVYPDDEPLVRRHKQTQDMLAKVAESEPIERVKRLLGTDTTAASTRNWKIWMTEFNVHQPSALKTVSGADQYETGQDMAHALVMADWTGRLLEQNVERLFVHSLDHHPVFGLVQYANLGTTIETPRVMTSGQVYGMYAQAFGKTMVRNTVTGNRTLTAPSGKAYPQLAVYSSIAADGQSLRVVVINRHLTQEAQVKLDTQGTGRRVLANGEATLRQLHSALLTDNNYSAAPEKVKWTDPVKLSQNAAAGLQDVSLPPASVSWFTLPLQP